MPLSRVRGELEKLKDGGVAAEVVEGSRACVIYRGVPTSGGQRGLPAATDVIVPVPPGYPASVIDLAGLPVGSPFLPVVKGGQNSQGVIEAAGQQWQLASYHPHNGGGGPPWNPMRHGFHTYLDQLIAWLDRLT
jgi:hypothetical protein